MKENILVINTGPILALVAATNGLGILNQLYDKVIVSLEVCEEIEAGGLSGFAVVEFRAASGLTKLSSRTEIDPFLGKVLDRGEASVIQLAHSLQPCLVCIDEAAGRRVARLYGMPLTGSIGILIRAKREGLLTDAMSFLLERMSRQGVYISDRIKYLAIKETGE